MTAVFYVIENGDSVIVKIYRVYENVDDFTAEFLIQRITSAELFQPCEYFFFGEADSARDPEFSEIDLQIGFNGRRGFDLIVDMIPGCYRRIQQQIGIFVNIALQFIDAFFEIF